MDDKGGPISSKNRAIFIDGKEVKVVKDSLSFDEDHDKLVDPFPQNRMSFSFYCEHLEFKKWLDDNPLTHAQEMVDELNEDLRELHTTNPPRNRKERRAKARELKKNIARFKAYCKKYNLTIKREI